MPLKELSGIFPKLVTTEYTIKSAIDSNYNCVAWALGDKLRWWEPYGLIIPAPFPPYYWPPDFPQNLQPQTFVALFMSHGFEVTDDPTYEDDFDKLAIYVRDNKFQHVARQLPNGRWTSKIGGKEDIEHDLSDLESDGPYSYGEVSICMKRRK